MPVPQVLLQLSLHDQVRSLAEGDHQDAELVRRIRDLEDLKAVAAATQARLAARLDASVRRREAATGVPEAGQARGVAAELALARRESPVRGAQHLGLAQVLVRELPHTLAALTAGTISEWRATLIARETACLSREDRATVEATLFADGSPIQEWGDRRLVDEARRIAYRLDPHSVTARAARAESERRVSLRPAPDTMTWLGALLPVRQGVAVRATLTRLADAAVADGDGRSRGQLMADLLVERVTGSSVAEPVRVSVELTVSDQTLLGAGDDPAWLRDYGTVPAPWARQLVSEAALAGRADLRLLYVRPRDGSLVAVESGSRLFPSGLAHWIDVRDQTCRTAWCDAPVRHHDHVRSWMDGGPTSVDNGQGLCVQCNLAKQAPGWRARATGPPGAPHVVETTTPSGQTVTSAAPGLPAPQALAAPGDWRPRWSFHVENSLVIDPTGAWSAA